MSICLKNMLKLLRASQAVRTLLIRESMCKVKLLVSVEKVVFRIKLWRLKNLLFP